MQTQIVFRMDDIAPEMDWKRFETYVDLFDRYQLCPLMGIIPDNKNQQLKIEKPKQHFWGQMRFLKKQGWSIAQHGYQHLLTSRGGLLNPRSKSEFAGLSIEEQYEKVWRGQQILIQEDLKTDIWMAPWHSYDQATLVVLRQLDFAYVTDGLSLRPYTKLGIKFIPCQIEKPRVIPFAVITICIHSNTLSEHYLKTLDSFIKKNRHRCLDFKQILTAKSNNQYLNVFSEKMIIMSKNLRRYYQQLKNS